VAGLRHIDLVPFLKFGNRLAIIATAAAEEVNSFSLRGATSAQTAKLIWRFENLRENAERFALSAIRMTN
jgi:hypothetical protein